MSKIGKAITQGMGCTASELSTTVDQWREALDQAGRDDPGDTAAELAARFGHIPRTTMHDRLKQLVRQGRCAEGRATRIDAAGRKYHVNVYHLLEK